jgi:hypothetical protein
VTPSRGSVPFGEISSGDRLRAALPHQHLPLPGFRTLTAASSRLGLAALFRAASARRIAVFRAFSTQPAAPSLDVRSSHAVSANARLQSLVPAGHPFLRPHLLQQRRSRCSLDLLALRGSQVRTLAFASPPVLQNTIPKESTPGTSGYQTFRAWVELREFRRPP